MRETIRLHTPVTAVVVEALDDTLLGGSEDALDAHTRRMLALEAEFIRRFPRDVAPDPLRTRAGSRRAASPPRTADRSAGRC